MTSASMSRGSFHFILHIAACILVLIVAGALDSAAGQSHRARKGSICGNPKVSCKTSVPFEPYDLPFRVPARAVIWDTELFYAIILKSVPTTEDDCSVFVPESERTAAQVLFPDHKVFTSRCAFPGEPNSGMLSYTNVSPKFRIMAAYGGTTLAESRRVLASVKATGKFPGAYVRRMRAGFNGT
ncbi:MAG: hypothetical protein ACREA9_07115 [Pyrinomonadaceae bacterium]